MSKRETIDLIRRFNPTAQPEFLASFEQMDLLAYLHQLQEVERDRSDWVRQGAGRQFELAMA
jgi:hypothetical protein